MWKFLGILAVIAIILAGGAIYYVLSNLNSIVRTEIVTYGSAATGTKVSLNSVDLQIAKGSGALKGLSIANPEGFSSDPALAMDRIAVTIDTNSVLSTGPIVIKEVSIDSPSVNYEAGLSGSNLSAIQKHVTDYANSLTGGGSKPSAGAKKSERKLIIQDLYVRNGAISISHQALQGRKLSANLPEIHLHNIGKGSNGATYAEVTKQILGA
ncbi:MAG TPA: hypothetical protein VEH07_03265, partial [Alphaproteobacteria bacterium]|nr:hypothetical protein [Alphaproteobacteria bacterium]